jgi:hypothetical protein
MNDHYTGKDNKKMAKVTLNKLLEVLSGAVGGLVFRQRPDGTIILSGSPRHNKRKTTQKQKAHRERFRQAAKHARWAARKHPIYAELAKGTWKSAYNFALSDWWHPPVIHQVQRQADKILVQASDNIRVAKVVIKVRDGQGNLLEKGEGVPQAGEWWEYIPNTSGATITVEAWDLAENVTKSTL